MIYKTGNGIGDEGSEALAESLRQNSSLTDIDLQCTLFNLGAMHVLHHAFCHMFRL